MYLLIFPVVLNACCCVMGLIELLQFICSQKASIEFNYFGGLHGLPQWLQSNNALLLQQLVEDVSQARVAPSAINLGRAVLDFVPFEVLRLHATVPSPLCEDGLDEGTLLTFRCAFRLFTPTFHLRSKSFAFTL